jgi:hypothetical protein
MAMNSGRDVRRGGWRLWSLIITFVSLTASGLAWLGISASYWQPHSQPEESTALSAIHAVVEQIIRVESDGDPNAKNKRSTATGLGQFLDETWLDMIRAHRPDLAKGRSQAEILELRRDAKITREITARFTERNAEMLRKRGLPVTPGTLYLAHFAGSAGAVAILSALEDADAAFVMANADATGRTNREKIVKANPFLERFTGRRSQKLGQSQDAHSRFSCHGSWNRSKKFGGDIAIVSPKENGTVKSIDPLNAGFKDSSTRTADNFNGTICEDTYDGVSVGTFDRSHGSEMLTSEDHRQLAERCIKLAKACTKPSVAEYLMTLAANYQELAERALRLRQLTTGGRRQHIKVVQNE